MTKDIDEFNSIWDSIKTKGDIIRKEAKKKGIIPVEIKGSCISAEDIKGIVIIKR